MQNSKKGRLLGPVPILTAITLIVILVLTALPGLAGAGSGSKVIKVYPLPSHTFVQTANGSIWAWGENQYGSLGDGTTTNHPTPVKPIINNVAELYPQSAGHTFALKNDGTLWAWERNWDGRIGAGEEITGQSAPVKILDNVDKIFPHEKHSFALQTDGTLWAWGLNNHGQLGDGTTTNRFEPVLIDIANVVRVFPANDRTYAILSNATLWAWGNNQHGKLGDGTTAGRTRPVIIMEDVKKVYPLDKHTFAFKNDHSLWSWGHNWYGQLGLGSNDNQLEPAQINLSGVTNFYPREKHAFAMKEDGSLWSWGYNWYGQLGDGSITNRTRPVQIPVEDIREVFPHQDHTFLLKNDQSLWGWGHNWDGRLGDNSSAHIRPKPVLITDNIKNAYIMEKHAFALDNQGKPLAWGRNGKTQLGTGTSQDTSSPVEIALDNVMDIFPQDSHTFALKEDGTLWAWGDNSKGQLGVGNFQTQDAPTRVLLGDELPAYNISLKSNPHEGGTTIGGGQYGHGESVQIKAMPNQGYSFVNWTAGNQEVSSEPTYSFPAFADYDIVANFKLSGETTTPGAEDTVPETDEPLEEKEEDEEEEEKDTDTFDIVLKTWPEESGTVEGGGTYDKGSRITIKAEAFDGYNFINWTEVIAHEDLNDDYDTITDIELIVSDESSYEFDVSRDRTVTANFELLEIEDASITAVFAENGRITVTFNHDLNEEPALEDFKAFFLAEIPDSTTGTSTVASYENHDESPAGEENELNNSSDEHNTDETGESVEENVEEEGGDIEDTESSGENDAPAWNGLDLSALDWSLEEPARAVLSFEPFEPAGSPLSYLVKLSYLDQEEIQADPFVVDAYVINYTVNLAADPTEAGSVTGSGTFKEGEELTVRAEANEGYEFVNWTETLIETEVCEDTGEEETTETKVIVSIDLNYTFTIEDDRTLVASFEEVQEEPESFELQLAADPPEAGSVEGGGTFKEGEEITVRAEANEGYEFVKWSLEDEEISTEESFDFIMPGSDVTITATFEAVTPLYELNLQTSPAEAGTATGSGSYEEGTLIDITLELAGDYIFLNWTENGEVISEDIDFTYTMPGDDRTLVANFEEVQEEPESFELQLAADPPEAGSVEGGGLFKEGEEVTVRAEANEGYEFVKWSLEDEEISTEESFVFIMPGSDVTVTATFEKSPVVSEQPQEEEELEDPDQGTTDPDDPDVIHSSGGYEEPGDMKNPTFTPPDSSSRFADDAVTEPEKEAELFYVDLYSEPEDKGLIMGEGFYEPGEAALLVAAPEEGYIFFGWLDGIDIVSFDQEYIFNVNEDTLLTALFEPEPDDGTIYLSLSSNLEEAGTTIGEGIYTKQEEAVVKAKVTEGYVFINWTDRGTVVSEKEEYRFIIDNDLELVANFAPGEEEENKQFQPESIVVDNNYVNKYTINLVVRPAGSGQVSGEGQYRESQIVGLDAHPDPGYKFTGWFEEGFLVSRAKNYAFEIHGNRSLTAIFSPLENRQNEIPETYRVSLAANPREGGSVYGSGLYSEGDKITISALPDIDYIFINWTENGREISTDIIYTFHLDRELKLVANFEPLYNDFYDGDGFGSNQEYNLDQYISAILVEQMNKEDLFVNYFSSPFWFLYHEIIPAGGE